jgi:hypothetical protein
MLGIDTSAIQTALEDLEYKFKTEGKRQRIATFMTMLAARPEHAKSTAAELYELAVQWNLVVEHNTK